jgi:hypothetical protein
MAQTIRKSYKSFQASHMSLKFPFKFQFNFTPQTIRKLSKMVQAIQLTQFNLQIKILDFFGLWQPKNCSRTMKLRGFMTVLVFISITFILPLTNLLYFGLFFEEIGGYILFYSGPNFKILIFVFRMRKFMKIVEEMYEILEETKWDKNLHRLRLKRHTKSMTTMFRTFLGLLLCNKVLDLIVSLIENHLPYKSWIPSNHQFTADHLVPLLILQVVLSIFADLVSISLEMLSVFVIGIASIMVAELSERMELLCGIQAEDELDYSELKKCAEIHQRISKFVTEIEKQFSVLLFIQGFFSSGYICLAVCFMSMVIV